MSPAFVAAALLLTVIYRHFVGPLFFYNFFYKNLEKWQKFKIQKKAPSPEKVIFDRRNTFKSAAVDVSIILITYFVHSRGLSQISFGWDFNFDFNFNSDSNFGPQNVFFSLIVFFGLFFIQDFYFYVTHAFFHNRKLYRHIHAVHHQSTNPTPWTSFSHHFLENFVELLIYPLLICLIPMNFFVLISFVLTTTTINFLGHCGFEVESLSLSRFKYFRWVASYTFHNRHHQYFNGNYALYFTFWDRIFKTEIKPK
jgi:lathosterol oxidase